MTGLVILGAGGKMGPSLAVLAQRAATAAGKPLQVVAVSRFTDTTARDWLEANAVRTLAAIYWSDQRGDYCPMQKTSFIWWDSSSAPLKSRG